MEKNVVDNAIADNEGTSIAIFECLPCKTGTGENNGYVIGYGEGDTWSDDGIEVYLEKTICTNLNDYASILVKDSSYDDADSFKQAMQGVMLYYVLATPEEYPIVTKTAPNYVGSDYGVEEFAGSKVPLVANILFYMRSLVSETRNFLDRLMAGLGTSDATAVVDKIIAAIASDETGSETTELKETVD